MPTTWTNQSPKEGGQSALWADPVVTWASALYEWDGQLATTWTNETEH